MTTFHQRVAAALAAALACLPLLDASPTEVGFVQLALHRQGEDGVVRRTGAALQFSVDFDAPTAGVAGVVRKPDGTSVALVAGELGLVLRDEAATDAELALDWPAGRYVVELTEPGSGDTAYAFDLATPLVAPPSIENLAELANLPAGTAFTARLGGFLSQASDGVLLADIVGDDGVVLADSGDLGQSDAVPATRTELLLPGLPVNGLYEGRVAVTTTLRRSPANGGATTVLSTTLSVLSFDLRTPGVSGGPAVLFPGERWLRGADGWREIANVGRYHVSRHFPWVYFSDHGWLYAGGAADPVTARWFYEPRLGWLWLDTAVYPFLFSHADSRWLRYQIGTRNPRWFFDYVANAWRSEP